LASPLEIVESDMTHVMDSYEHLGRQVQNEQIKDTRMAEIIRATLIPGLTRVQAKLEVLKPNGENERRRLEVDIKLTRALLTQVTAMAMYVAGRDPKQNELVENSAGEIEKLNVEWKRLRAPTERVPASR
jgi:hypothetical protein